VEAGERGEGEKVRGTGREEGGAGRGRI